LDIQADPDFQNKQEAAREGWQSMLVVPLLAGPERAVGTLSIYSTIKREEFTRWELDLLRVCAGQAGVAIQNAERLRMIQRLNEVGRSLGTLQESPEAFQETLKQIADAAIEVLGADVVDLYQYRADRDDFVLPPIMVGERRVPDLVPTQISPDDVVVEIAYTGEAIYTSDAQEHPLLAGDWEFPREERPKERFVVREGIISSAAVPMKVGEEVLGVMFAGYRQRRDFDTDVELREKIEVLANQGAIAISNARLFEKERRRAKELEVVNEIGRAVSARGIEEIAELIYEQTSRLMDTTNFFICLYDKDREELSFELWMYKEQPLEKFSNKLSGLTGWIVREKKPLLIRDWDEEESRFPVKADIQTMRQRSWLGVPLLVGEEVIGVISVQSPEPYAFNPDTQRLLETIASQAAIAIKNAQLFEELDERAKQFVQLQAVTAAISAEPSNLERVSRLIVDSLGNIFYNASCAIRLYDSATDEFRPQIGTGVIAKWIDRLPRSDGTSRYVVKSKTARYLEGNDVVTPSDGGPSVREDILALGIKAVAYLPLTSRGDVVGVLYVNLTVPHRFSENDKLLLGLFADQAAIAIENTRLYTELDRRVRQLEVLAGIYERIIAVGIEDVDRILDLLYEEASEVMDLSNAQVQMAFYDEIRDEVTFPLAMEQDGGDIIDVVRWAKREAQYRKLGESEVVEQFKPRARREPPGLTEHVIRTEQPLLITEDFEQRAAGLGITVWPTFGRLDRPTHSWLGVPMIVQDRVIGIISIQSLEVEHAFDQGNVELLTTVASQAAVAIENARLYQDLEQKIKELAQAQNRLVTAERLTLMSQVAAEFVHRLGNLVGTIPVRVALIKEKLDPADASDSAILHIAEGIKTDTEGLLQFARDLERPTIRLSPEPVDLNQLVRNAVVQQGVPSNVRLVENLSPSIPDIMAPKDHLLETLKNLLGNAIDAMPEGGT
nr:GAF domain-containing protein [Chloroflexota bacterium]